MAQPTELPAIQTEISTRHQAIQEIYLQITRADGLDLEVVTNNFDYGMLQIALLNAQEQAESLKFLNIERFDIKKWFSSVLIKETNHKHQKKATLIRKLTDVSDAKANRQQRIYADFKK